MDWETLALEEVSLHGLLTSSAFSVADWSVVHLFHGKWRARGYRTSSMMAVVVSEYLWGFSILQSMGSSLL